MGIVSFIVLVLNIILLVGIDVVLWMLDAGFGLGGLLSIGVWLITYTVTEEIAIAPRDFWVNSAFGIVMKKIWRAWLVTVVTGAITLLVGHWIIG